MTEEALFSSASMRALTGQVTSLLTEVQQRENLEHEHGELQSKLQAALADKKLMINSFQQRLDELKGEVETLRQERTFTQEKLLRAQ